MKNITHFATLLLSFATLPCSARLSRRAGPPDLLDNRALDILSNLNGSLAGPADPNLKILSKVPYDEQIGGLTLRITKLRPGPFISTYTVIPCMIMMISTAFNAVWNEVEQHPHLQDDRYDCSSNGITLKVVSNKPPLKSMEYSDLVYLSRMLLNFQQAYRLPVITFDYLEDRVVTGSGGIYWDSSGQNLEEE